MKKMKWMRWLSISLAIVLLISTVAAALSFDLNSDGKTNVWDLQLALSQGKTAEEQAEAVREALGGGDELHKNAEGQWEIWSTTGLYNMAKHAQSGDTFVLMQDIDMAGAVWQPIADFNGTFLANQHQISNMKITQDVNGAMGFFANIAKGGTVYRLNLSGMNMIASQNATAIGLVAGTCAGKVDACTAIGFLTDARETLPADLKVGGLVGTLVDGGVAAANVENMLHKEGEGIGEIPNVSVKLGVRTLDANREAYAALVKIVGDPSNGSVDSMLQLENLTGIMADPNAIAWVRNGDTYTYPLDLKSLLDAISSDGNSEVTLQADLYSNQAIIIPYSCTLDCNGHLIQTNLSSGNCLQISATGSENKTFTLKNGTMRYYTLGIRVNKGAVVVSNMEMIGLSGAAVGIYETESYTDINLIENSTLSSGAWGCLTYNVANTDMSANGITIRNSKLISYKSSGSSIFVINDNTVPGNVTLGVNVDLYTYGSGVSQRPNLVGEDPVKMDGTASVTVDGVTYTGLSYWTTDEALISSEAMAEVTNGSTTTQVTSVKNMTAAISSTGTTEIKLLKDVSYSSQMTLPYSCTLDLNGFTIANTAGDCIVVNEAGSQKSVTTIKNGTISHKSRGIKVLKGGLALDNVDLIGQSGSAASIALHDPNSKRADNKISNCYIFNPNSLTFYFNEANVDFTTTGMLVENSTLIPVNNYMIGMASNAVAGVIEFGENVEVYSSKTKLSGSRFTFSGTMAGLTQNVTLEAQGKQWTLNNWSTNKQTETSNVLLLGNSLSTTTPEELYEIAKSKGISVTVTDLYHGGACGWQHKEWIENDAPEYEYRVYNDMGFWLHGDIKTVDAAIDFMEWDHVSYQEWFQKNKGDSVNGVLKDFTFEAACTLFEGYNDWIYDYLKTNIPNAKFYCFQHWSWQVGHGHVKDVDTQTQMYQMIKETTEYFADKYDVTIIPSGLAFQYARQDSRIGDVLCKTPNDYVHDNGPTGGQYLNGCVFFEVMYQTSCIGNTWRGTNAPADNETHEILEQHAHNAVAAYFGNDYAK